MIDINNVQLITIYLLNIKTQNSSSRGNHFSNVSIKRLKDVKYRLGHILYFYQLLIYKGFLTYIDRTGPYRGKKSTHVHIRQI